jgi:predicted ATPase
MTVSSALDSIAIKGFRSIASLEVSLRPINVLIGANGSGKSNFIEVFSLLHEIEEGRLLDYVRKAGGAEQLLHFGSKVSKEIEVQISIGRGKHQYSLALKPTEFDDLYRAREGHTSPDGVKLVDPRDDPLRPQPRIPDISKADDESYSFLRDYIGRWRLYHLNDTSTLSPIRKTSQLRDNAFLRADGSNLAAFLYLLKEKSPQSYSLIRRTVRRVAPFFDDFLLKPDPLNEETIRVAWKHKNSDQYFAASALSDGSLRFIMLTTLLLQPEKLLPSVILVDEPELGLHPYAITMLASLIKRASVKTQVILSTQSSLLLDHFEPEDVLVAERLHGATQLRRLESSQLESWLEDYSLGQLWEKNELGGRPGQE